MSGQSRASVERVLRFLAVGGAATIIHFSVLIALVEGAGAEPTLATSAGYAVSAGFNYIANRSFTFRSDALHHAAVPRFLAMCLLGLSLNAAGMWAWTSLGLHYVAAQVLTTLVVVTVNYLVASRWVFPVRAGSGSGGSAR